MAGIVPRTRDGERAAGEVGLLRNRSFILLLCAYAVSAMGDHISEMAILKTQNALSSEVDITAADARMTFVFMLPFFLFGPAAGWLADRLPRRGLMIVADFARVGILLSFASLIAWTSNLGSWGPYLPLLPVGIFATVFAPARCALMPSLVRKDQLVRANGMISGLGIIATMGAILIGGYLAAHYAPAWAFRVDAATYLLSAIMLMMLVVPASQRDLAEKKRETSLKQELFEGFRYAKRHRRVLELLAIAALMWFCGSMLKCTIPAVVRDTYGGGFQTISAYRAALGGGFILGAITISTLSNSLRSEIAITWSLFGIGLGVGVFALSTYLPLPAGYLATIGAVGVVMAGMFGVIMMASYNALLQRIVPDRHRGRVFGVKECLTTGGLLLATGSLAFPQGIRIDHWVGIILIVVAGLAIIAGFITLRVRMSRTVHGPALHFVWHINEFISKAWWRLRIAGRSTVPREGPVIVTANHVCAADPFFLTASVPYRPISFLTAAEYTGNPVSKFILGLVDCIPVKRDGRDMPSTKQSIKHLREGKALGIFIEGRIMLPGEKADPKNGVAMLALKTGATVIPAHISGVKRTDEVIPGLRARHRAVVRFGEAVDLSEFDASRRDRETVRAATCKIYEAIRSLAPPGYHEREGVIFDPLDQANTEADITEQTP